MNHGSAGDPHKPLMPFYPYQSHTLSAQFLAVEPKIVKELEQEYEQLTVAIHKQQQEYATKEQRWCDVVADRVDPLKLELDQKEEQRVKLEQRIANNKNLIKQALETLHTSALVYKNSESMWQIGRLYCEGRGVGQDKKLAMQWIRRAALAGSVQAQTDLAMDESTEPFEKLMWAERAAAPRTRWFVDPRTNTYRQSTTRYLPALIFLGDLYVNGIGGSPQIQKGFQYLCDGFCRLNLIKTDVDPLVCRSIVRSMNVALRHSKTIVPLEIANILTNQSVRLLTHNSPEQKAGLDKSANDYKVLKDAFFYLSNIALIQENRPLLYTLKKSKMHQLLQEGVKNGQAYAHRVLVSLAVAEGHLGDCKDPKVSFERAVDLWRKNFSCADYDQTGKKDDETKLGDLLIIVAQMHERDGNSHKRNLCYKEAVALGNAQAKAFYGDALIQGKVKGERNKKGVAKGIELLEQAAVGGVCDAARCLVDLYGDPAGTTMSFGYHVDQDLQKAVYYAGFAGVDPTCKLFLARCYMFGWGGCPRDIGKGMSLFMDINKLVGLPDSQVYTILMNDTTHDFPSDVRVRAHGHVAGIHREDDNLDQAVRTIINAFKLGGLNAQGDITDGVLGLEYAAVLDRLSQDKTKKNEMLIKLLNASRVTYTPKVS